MGLMFLISSNYLGKKMAPTMLSMHRVGLHQRRNTMGPTFDPNHVGHYRPRSPSTQFDTIKKKKKKPYIGE